MSMRKIHAGLLSVAVALALSASGCVYLIIGGVGALGGYVVSPDTVEGITENEMSIVFDAALEIVAVMGTIQEQHPDAGVLIAKIHGAKVTITSTSITPSTTKLTVKARKAMMPRISVAQDVFVKVMSYVNE